MIVWYWLLLALQTFGVIIMSVLQVQGRLEGNNVLLAPILTALIALTVLPQVGRRRGASILQRRLEMAVYAGITLIPIAFLVTARFTAAA